MIKRQNLLIKDKKFQREAKRAEHQRKENSWMW